MSSSVRKINLKTSKCPLAHSIIICMFAEKRNTSMKSEVYKRQKPFAG